MYPTQDKDEDLDGVRYGNPYHKKKTNQLFNHSNFSYKVLLDSLKYRLRYKVCKNSLESRVNFISNSVGNSS